MWDKCESAGLCGVLIFRDTIWREKTGTLTCTCKLWSVITWYLRPGGPPRDCCASAGCCLPLLLLSPAALSGSFWILTWTTLKGPCPGSRMVTTLAWHAGSRGFEPHTGILTERICAWMKGCSWICPRLDRVVTCTVWPCTIKRLWNPCLAEKSAI